MPFRAAWPAWSGFVIVPKFAVTPLASDAVIPMMSGIAVAGVFSRRAAAAAAAIVPTVPVACQPAVRDMVGAARERRPQTSAPTISAASISDGVDLLTSA